MLLIDHVKKSTDDMWRLLGQGLHLQHLGNQEVSRECFVACLREVNFLREQAGIEPFTSDDLK